MAIDRKHHATELSEFLLSVGVKIMTADKCSIWRVHASDTDGQQYHLTGEDLYDILLELAEQVGIEWD
jgi:hypothetical protein